MLNELFASVLISEEVRSEVGFSIHGVQVVAVRRRDLITQWLPTADLGEVSTIVLGLETPACTILMDDKRGRRLGRMLNSRMVGTLGLLLIAKNRGLLKAVRPVVESMIQNGCYLSEQVMSDAFREAGE